MAAKWTTKNGYTITKILSGRSNVFFISKGKGCVLVDTSVKQNFKKLCNRIDHVCQDGKVLKQLILTHAHYDHVDNAKTIKEKYKTKIIAQKNHIDNLLNGSCPVPKGALFINKWVDKKVKNKSLKTMTFEAIHTDIIIEEMYNLDEFAHVSIIHTPGHTSGSISVLVDNEVAIVGDAMFGIFRNSVYPPWADSTLEMVKSWQKLLDTKCHTFLPSHGTEVSRELLLKQYEKYKED